MVRKFVDTDFMSYFEKNFQQELSEWRYPAITISLTKIAIKTCRELRYAQWKNRDKMIELIKNWFNSQPQRDDGRFGKKIFGRNCHLAAAWGPTFISIQRFSLVNAGDLICFW